MERKPEWLHVEFPRAEVEKIACMMEELNLHTVCKEANCPNLGECYKKHTATFMVMGSACTRNCRFCNVSCAKPQPLDPDEPRHLAEVAKKLALRHVVVTQVTRDDLPDGGAAHMAAVVRAVHETCPGTTVEVLISDLKGSEDALRVVLDAKPEVLNHNVEMVSRLYHDVRPQARYERSLKVLSDSKKFAPNILTKTGFLLGLGETDDEVYALMDDIRATGCDILTISQYLQPSPQHWALQRYVTPGEFARLKDIAMEKGFKFVASSPLVRSSYRAAEAFEAAEGRV